MSAAHAQARIADVVQRITEQRKPHHRDDNANREHRATTRGYINRALTIWRPIPERAAAVQPMKLSRAGDDGESRSWYSHDNAGRQGGRIGA